MAEVIAFEIQINGINTVVSNVERLNGVVRQTQTAFRAATHGTVERANLQTQLNQLTAAQGQLNQQQRAAAAANGASVGSYRQMNLELGQLRTRYRELSAEDRNGAIGSGLQRQIQTLNRELVSLDAGIGNYQRNVGNYASSFNSLGSILSGLGIGFGIAEVTSATADFSLKLSELQSITGVSGEDLEKLKGSISDLTSITVEGGKAIVSSGSDIAEAFKLAGSARPELLSNIDALQDFTKNAIIFAKSGGLSVQDAITSMSSVLAQFGKPATDATQVMNVLAAGAKAGASEIKDTSAAIEQFGAGAASANVTVEESVALVETLGDKFIKGGEAGTKIRNILLAIKAPQGLDKKAQEELRKYGVSFETLSNTALPLSDRLRELSKILNDDNALLQVFGKENVTAGEILLQNVDRFDQLNAAVTGTNEAFIQAAINTDNLAQLISNAKNAAINLAVGIGTTLYTALNIAIDAIQALSQFIDDNQVALLAAGFAVAAYATTLNSSRLVLLSFQAAQIANTVVTNTATIAQRTLALATAAVPYVAVGIAIFGVVKAMQSWFGATEEQIKSQEVLLESQTQLTEAYASEAQSAAELFAIAKSDVSSKEQKAAAVQKIISLYPNYLNGITTEEGVLNNLDAVQKSVNKGILDGAIARIKAQKIQEATASLIDLELKKQQLLFEFEKKGIDTNSGVASLAVAQIQGNIDEVKKRISDLPTFLAKVGEGLGNQNIDFTGLSVSDNQIKEVQNQIKELAQFRFNLNKATGKDLDEEGKKRYDFLVSEEKRLQIERQKLIDSNLKNEDGAIKKGLDFPEVPEPKKIEIKTKAAKESKAETLDELLAKLKALQGQLNGLSNTPSKIPSSLLDDISKTKKEIDDLQAKLKVLFDKPLEGAAASRAEASATQTIGLNTDVAEQELRDYLAEKEALNAKSTQEQNNVELQKQKELLDLKAANDKAAAEKEAEQRKEVLSEIYSNALSLAKQASDAIFSIISAENRRELDGKLSQLESEKDAELALAGGNAISVQQINERFAAQKLELDRKAFEENKKLQIAQAVINGALAATAVFAVPDFTFGVLSAIRLGFIAANTALQIGVIESQKFATGGLVRGQGTDTSDNIPALLSPNEFVIKASSVRKIGAENLERLNNTGSLANIGTSTPIPTTGQRGLTQSDINAIIQGVRQGSYEGTQSGVNDGIVQANRENNVINKLR